MKKGYIIIGLIVLIVVVLFIIFFKRKEDKMEIKDILHVYLTYSKGYMANSNINYIFDYNEKEDKYLITVKPYLVDDDDKKEIEVTKEFGNKIKDILIKYDVYKWNGFKKYDQNVLDGDSFSFSVSMKDDLEIEASGYMMWPENYSKVINEFDTLFMDEYNKRG